MYVRLLGPLKVRWVPKGITLTRSSVIYTIAKLDHEDRPSNDGFVVVRINTITKLGNIYNNTVEGFGVVRINTIAKQDSDGTRYELIDYNISREKLYKRGVIGELVVTVETKNVIKTKEFDNEDDSPNLFIGEETQVFINNFIPDKALN